jgi:hypothetical protein
VSGCAGQARIQPVYPPATDLKEEEKPEITPEVLESDVAAAEYDSSVEAWGERGWATVDRLCRYFKTHGMKIECGKPE